MKWTKKEDSVLIKNANASVEAIMTLLPNRNWSAVEHRMHRLRLKRQRVSRGWDDRELKTLIEGFYYNRPYEDICQALPSRSKMAIKSKAHLLGLKQIKTHRPIKFGGTTAIDKMVKGDTVRFGISSDGHLGSKYAQITYRKKFYDIAEREGVDFMTDAGDTTDGNGTHYPGQRHEMHITGADNLKDFVVKHYPKFKARNGKMGITYGIAGYHDLDLWVKEGYDLLKRVEDERPDYKCLGHASAVLRFKEKNIRIMHPAGGTAYAISYRPQKTVESFSSENKPHILIFGHFHKAEFLPLLRNVFSFQAGCFQAQTPFGVRKNLAFHYGGWIVEFGVVKSGDRNSDMSITRMKAEFVPFYRPVVEDFRNWN